MSEPTTQIKQILSGHTSAQTAYVVDDYPYGFRLRCKIRYWLEHHAKLGFRLASQTTNPRVAGEVWNKPKASTYVKFGACMFLDSEGHVQWSGLGEYCDGAEAQRWMQTYGEGVPESGRVLLAKWVAAKVAYDTHRKAGDDLSVGLREARQAWKEADGYNH
jgi:hypothetical protein